MLEVGDLVENSYSKRRYRVTSLRFYANWWIVVEMREMGSVEGRSISCYMRDGDEAPNAFRRVDEAGNQTGNREERNKKRKKNNKCAKCGAEGKQYEIKDDQGGVLSTRCRICGAEQY